jgi:hypothetical protein
MVGVIAQPFVTSAPFPFVLLLAMMISFPFKSDFFLLGRHRCVSFGYPAWASIKRSLPAPTGHLASRVMPDWWPE